MGLVGRAKEKHNFYSCCMEYAMRQKVAEKDASIYHLLKKIEEAQMLMMERWKASDKAIISVLFV